MLEAVAARLKIEPHFLQGAGESQIVAPDGTVLAKAPRAGEAVVVADFDVTLADDKHRPDGTHLFGTRRPELYGPLGEAPQDQPRAPGAHTATAAVYQPRAEGPESVEEAAEAVAEAARAGVQFIVLPELFHLPQGRVENPATTAAHTPTLIATLRAALQSTNADCHVVVSAVEAINGGYQHIGLLIGREGVVLRQPQLHACGRHPWITSLGNQLLITNLSFGRVALILGNDSLYPETFRLAALQYVEVVGVPTTLLEAWELRYGLPERAAENRLNVVVGARPNAVGASAIFAITEDFTLWTEWKNRPFDGNISHPVITHASASPGLTQAPIHPAASANHFVSQRTNLVEGRPWKLAGPIIHKE
jgi:predicted amidohydrolase